MPDLITERVIYDGIQALNQSGAKELLKSPAHYQAYLNRTQEDSKALRVGTAVHKLALEGLDAYNATHAIAPEVDKRTKEGKAAWAEFATANEGKSILTAEEGALVDAVANSAAACMKANGIVLSKTEVMFTAFIGETLVKCAIDGISDDGYIYDLKTCEDASPRGFLAASRKYNYALQNYFYRHAVESAYKCRVLGFRFIAVEKEPPYAHAVYELGPELMTGAAFDFEKALALYKECTASGQWPAYPQQIQTIDIAAKPTAATNINFA
jgi:exodeoxyribonuclease VIII